MSSRHLATALAGLALATAGPAAAAPVDYGSGHLDWGVKQSFREYITSPAANGSYTASNGAEVLTPGGAIRFDVLGGPYDDETGVGMLLIDGTVHFTGHEGTLDMTFKNLRVALAGGTGTLYADIRTKEPEVEEGWEHCLGIALADLGPVPAPTSSVSGLEWGSVPTKLATAAAPLFGGFYVAGVPFDPLAPLAADIGAPQSRPDRGDDFGPDNCRDDDGGNGGNGGGNGDGNPTPKPKPPPKGIPPSISGMEKAVVLGKGRTARIGTLRCGAARCAVTAPKTVKVKIKRKRKRYRVKVLAPGSLAANVTGKLRVKLTKAARKALSGRRATVKLEIAVQAADGQRVAETVKATLKAKQARPARKGRSRG